jgi:hypothetical protein
MRGGWLVRCQRSVSTPPSRRHAPQDNRLNPLGTDELGRCGAEHGEGKEILDAARACFARNGFHATSMQDVVVESGLSMGAVYRYCKTKDDLIQAIAKEVVA